MIEATLNMVFLPEIVSGCSIAYGEDGSIFLQNENGTECMGRIVESTSSITTYKEVKKLGNAIAIAIGAECKALGIEPGDKIEITIKKI